VQTLKHKNGMTYAEARRTVQARTPKPNISYSAAIQSKSVKDMSTQTDISALFTGRSHSGKIIKPTVVKPKTPTISTKITDTQTAAHDNPATSAINTKIKKRRKKPTPIKPKPLKFNFTPSKQLTKKDFLKNRPINTEPEIADSLKVYVSSEEEMLTESTSEAETDPPVPPQS
jgi:hypothetical protein